VAVGGAVRVLPGVATVVSLICGGWVPQDLDFVARSAVYLASAAGIGWLLISMSRTLLCAMPGAPGRLASRLGFGIGQAAFVVKCFCGTGVSG
jgi:hypothetical protein